ncbi:LamB/YcsF family protein [Clostridium manihotivorum]|uniref:5-oxoprolinase subunit A n=1 Tax=Clostridium manihotivorum TaxID=2320868 RepID=A0A3R5THS1_9CLOT|nr:5-oxoprolinase subunit PxpA [Clostridium manihotivorum]QAA33741.1 lactam utilization protein LamB [Clostridium manihotivorum]
MYNVDINCDMGESFGAYKLGNDKEIIKFISSANIACGFHAGDPSIMRKTVEMALENNVAIGAHPGFQDLSGFGRRNIIISPEEVYDLMVYQIGALYGFVKAEGGRMNHVKPHGALYNMAAKDRALAESIAKAVYDVDSELILFGLSGSEMIKAGQTVGIRTASEVFADRTYQNDGSLTPRSNPKALISSDKNAIKQVIKMITEGKVASLQGEEISIEAHTVCIHGDGEKALIFAKEINEALSMSGVQVKSLR